MKSRSGKALVALLGSMAVCTLGSTAVASGAAPEPITILSTTFDAGVPPEISGVTSTDGVEGYAGLGTGSNVFSGNFLRNAAVPVSPTTLTLTDLPAHDAIDIRFLLAIIDSWDGDGCHAGPDSFSVAVDGAPVFSEIFENSNCGGQSYVPPPGGELARRLALGFTASGFHSDSAYDMTLDSSFQGIQHTSSTLTIEWSAGGAGWQGGPDESWAIDNLDVIIHPVEVASEPPADDPGGTLPDEATDVTPEVDGTVETVEPTVTVLPRQLARTNASPMTPWLLGIGLASLVFGAAIRRRAATRYRPLSRRES